MKSCGAQAEQLAAQYLQQQGLKLLHNNYHCRYGEIDLIMQEGDMHIFVEVRLRGSDSFGGAAASIDRRKQAKLIKTAQHYLTGLKRLPPCRFDAVVMKSSDMQQIMWLRNAFTL